MNPDRRISRAIFLAALSLPLSPAVAVRPDFIVRQEAKAAFDKYEGLPMHRAFAHSPDGGYGYVSSRPNDFQARRGALAFCEDNRPTGAAFCQIVSVGTNTISPQEFSANTKRGYNDALGKKLSFYRLVTTKEFAKAQAVLDAPAQSAAGSSDNDQSSELLSVLEQIPLDRGQEILDPWVASSPKFWGAYAARATFTLKSAWKERGEKFSRQIAPERRARVAAMVQAAKVDLREALLLNERCLICYSLMISSSKLDGNSIEAKAMLDRGRKYFPNSSTLVNDYLDNFQPAWGGSERAMDELVQQAKAWLPAEKSKWVTAHREYLRGFWAVSERAQERAFEESLRLADHHSAAIRLAEIKRSQGNFTEMLQLMNRDLMSDPWDRYALELKAIALEKLNRSDEHDSTIDKLFELNRRERKGE